MTVTRTPDDLGYLSRMAVVTAERERVRLIVTAHAISGGGADIASLETFACDACTWRGPLAEYAGHLLDVTGLAP